MQSFKIQSHHRILYHLGNHEAQQFICFPDILRQTFQSLVPQFLRHPIKGFGNAAGNAGKGVAVAAQRNCIAKCIPLYQVSPLKSERIIVLMYFLVHQFPTPL